MANLARKTFFSGKYLKLFDCLCRSFVRFHGSTEMWFLLNRKNFILLFALHFSCVFFAQSKPFRLFHRLSWEFFWAGAQPVSQFLTQKRIMQFSRFLKHFHRTRPNKSEARKSSDCANRTLQISVGKVPGDYAAIRVAIGHSIAMTHSDHYMLQINVLSSLFLKDFWIFDTSVIIWFIMGFCCWEISFSFLIRLSFKLEISIVTNPIPFFQRLYVR